MDEKQRDLLNKRGVIILPEIINHDVYALMVEALIERPDEIIRLFCRGDGGDTRAALAIVDLMQAHGNVVGVLPGEANSSHVTIWAGTARRYVYPNAAIGLHKVAMDGLNTRVDSVYARQIADEYERTERAISEVLAGASNKSAAYWLDVLCQAGSGGVHQIGAAELIQMDMAFPIGNIELR